MIKYFKTNPPGSLIIRRALPYSPELNPSEKIWAQIKQFYKNEFFESLSEVKQWLYDFIKNNLDHNIVKSNTHS